MKAIILRLFLLLITVAVTAGITYAYFSSQVTSSGNVITSGTLSLAGPLAAQWLASGMKPGDSIQGNYALDNTGSIAAEHLEIGTSNSGGAGNLQEVLEVEKMLYGYDSNNDGNVFDEDSANTVDIIAVIISGSSASGGGTAATQDGDYTLILETAVDGSTNVAQLDTNNDNKITLEELAQAVIEVRAAGNNQGLAAGTDAAFYAKITLPVITGDAYQGKSNTLTWSYTLNQVVGQ